MQARAKAVCWRAASWTLVCLVAFGFVIAVVVGA